jgi:hypothetical protein
MEFRREDAEAMIEIIGTGVVIILLASFYTFVRKDAFEEVERQQAMRRSLMKLQEKNRHLNL